MIDIARHGRDLTVQHAAEASVHEPEEEQELDFSSFVSCCSRRALVTDRVVRLVTVVVCSTALFLGLVTLDVIDSLLFISSTFVCLDSSFWTIMVFSLETLFGLIEATFLAFGLSALALGLSALAVVRLTRAGDLDCLATGSPVARQSRSPVRLTRAGDLDCLATGDPVSFGEAGFLLDGDLERDRLLPGLADLDRDLFLEGLFDLSTSICV